MRLLMVSGDRQVVLGEKGPFHAMQREFSRHFERIDVLCPRPPREPVVRTIHERVHFHPAEVPPGRSASWIARTGEELITEHGHGLIVSHDYGWFQNGVGAARLSKRTGVPYVSEIHHVPGHPFASGWRERFDRSLARRYVRWARHSAAAFRVVNAGEMPPLLEKWGVPSAKILVLPSLYVDLEIFRPDPAGETFDQDIVFVGRMVENKGLDRIVDALGELAGKGKRFSILFVGRGPKRDSTRERVRRRGLAESARFVDWVESPEDLARIYRRSRLVVCASSCEGGPRFVVEALACGTPAVSTRVGVMGELLAEQDGLACGLLAGFTAESLALAIESALGDEDRRRAMGERAVAVASRFEYAKTIRGYAEGLKRLARQGPVKLLFLTQVVDAQDAVLGFVPRWIEGLARECARVRVVALEAGDISTLPANTDVRVVGRKGAISRWLRYRAILSEALETDGFDTVLAHMVPRYALLARRPARRAGAGLFLWYTHAGVDGRLRRAVRAVEKVFTASPESLRVETEKRVVTGHGIDLAHFSRADGEDSAPASPARILAVGRVTPRKDPLTAIESTAILVARGRDVHLDLVGSGLTEADQSYLPTVEDEIRLGALEGRVHRPGSVPYREVPAYYRRASVVVNASLTGSLDKVVLEAMAMERPVVSCNEAALPLFAELGEHSEMLAFEPGNAMQLADRIEALLSLTQAERDKLGQRLRAIAARDHEVDALMRRLVAEMGGAEVSV